MTVNNTYENSSIIESPNSKEKILIEEDMSTAKGLNGDDKGVREGISGLPNEAALKLLTERTGYPITQNNGQRRYGPPARYDGPIPCRGCEVFVGKLPRDCFEDDLVPIFEKVGPLYEMRLMMDYNGQNRGYAFVVYTNKRDAQKAVRTLNNFEIRKGRLLGVCQSVDNCRLFVGGIPKKVKRDEILEEISKVTECVVDVIVYPSATDKSKNRGFAFVEYENHRAAAMARRKLMSGRIQLWGHPIAVDWAEPEQEVDDEIMDQVKVLYVRNLMLTTTEETIEQIFKGFAEVERVKKIKDYCFVHFTTREGAREALQGMQGETIDGADVEVTLAKPVDKEHYRQQRAVAKLMQYAQNYNNYPFVPQEFPPSPPLPYSPMMPGISFFPPGVVPNRPPTFNNRPQLRGRGRTAAGSRSAGGRAFLLNGFFPPGQVYPGYPGGVFGFNNRKVKHVSEDRLYDLVPGMELTPTNPVTLKPQDSRTPLQVLEELCQKNSWGAPIFTLHSTVTGDGQLFLYKVTIPLLGSTYQPPKLCRNVDDAKLFACEHTLTQLSGETSSSPQLSPVVTTAPYQVRAMAPGHPQMNGTRHSEPTNFPGYVPMTTAPTAVMAKVSWPAGMPGAQEGMSNYFEFQEQQGYPHSMYQQY